MIYAIIIAVLVIAAIWFYFTRLVTPTATKFTEPTKKALVLYFSPAGKTKRLAEKVQAQTNADIVEIEGTKPYKANPKGRAFVEWVTAATPEVVSKLDDINDYDTIFLAYPIWYDTAPMIVKQVLKKHNFSNKNIVPVVSFNAVSRGEGRSIRMIRHHAPRANVMPRLVLQDNDQDTQLIKDYLNEVSYK